ncbi:hypothetical protein BN970_03141 [Mycolicibacterium conceptionense]|uniref:Transmembrane protein n=1 Tax=Mycolicibacterium conceptionense TaxID=451644 RepID=A0A0U1DF51_9MYCO|nr:hypothetical protein [Mycolicibacterium conceptionense]ORV20173.1 hypothetical protein AWB98_30110 [Mycolicibacterium conceptionense]CQD15100.1 hypothetical protein BN970_03141 [Mycolicibacterium conceptionense]
MTTPIESLRRAIRRPGALTAALVVGGATVAILLGISTAGQWVTVLASLAGFATAITMIAAVVISWEHVVLNARSAGLVETEVESR